MKKNILIFYISIIIFFSSIESRKKKKKSKIISNCEKIIKYYSKKLYYNQEFCYNNSQKHNSKCNENLYNKDLIKKNNEFKIFKICKKDLLMWYKRITKKSFDIEKPKTLNEKIQWMKLYDNTPLKTLLADKYLSREWIKQRIGEKYLIPLLGVWDSFDKINFDLLPKKFVLKANHGCHYNIIVENKNLFNIKKAKIKFKRWMKTNFAFEYGFQFHYINIKPKIIAEEYLEMNDKGGIYDYRVYCFNGKAKYIGFFSNSRGNWKIAFYDLEWNKLNFYYNYILDNKNISKPKNLKLMIELSEKIAIDFAFVRIDYYILNNGTLKIGEITFTPTSGTAKWFPSKQDLIFGNMIILPSKKPFPIYFN